MRNRTSQVRVSLFATALFTSLSTPAIVRAQGNPGQKVLEPAAQPVSVKLEQVDIHAALQMIFHAAKISYTVDQDVKGTVTASFEQTPFRVALTTLLQSAPMPLTYRLENGIYTILPRSKELGEEAPGPPLILKLRPINTTATAIVQQIKAMPQFGLNTGITYQVNPGDNSIVVTSANDQQYRNFQQAVRLLDTPTREVTVNAEVVLMLAGKDGKNHKDAVAMRGRTVSEGTIKLQMTAEGKAFSDSPVVVSAGDYNVTLKPTINGDDSIQVEAEVNLDLTYRLPGDSRAQHLRQKFSGSGRYVSGDTILLASATLKSQNGKTQAKAAELLIFLTPDLIQPRMPKQSGPGGSLPTPASTKGGDKRESLNAPPTRKE